MRLGRLVFRHSIVVDLDNEEMCFSAKEQLLNDIDQIVLGNAGDQEDFIYEEENSSLSVNDIDPDMLDTFDIDTEHQ